ncbi:MAG: EI24 domain-containing protein [Planctomycetales bacterium]|nr:EI24 domain-containing protein [Planctomycetales bacterium]
MTRRGPLAEAGLGATAPIRGLLLLLGSPWLWPLAAVPCLVATLALALLLAAGWVALDPLLGWLWPLAEGEPAGFLRTLAAVGVGLLLALAAFGVSILLAPALAEPFLGRLARRVRERTAGPGPETPGGLVAGLVVPIVNQGKKLAFLVAANVLLLPLLLVPGLGAAAYAALALTLTWFLLGLTYLEYPLETGPRLLTPRERRRYLYAHLPAGLALGAVSSLAALVPCVTFLLLPAAVAGATLLYLDLGGDESLPGGRAGGDS